MARLFNFGEKRGAQAHLDAAVKTANARTSGKPATESDRAAAVELMAAQSSAKAAKSAPARASSVTAAPERRHRRRVKISAPVRVRQVYTASATEFDLTMTADVSREGILFETSRTSYARGQEVAVVFPYNPAPGEFLREKAGLVVRVSRASESRYGVAVAFVEGAVTHELTDSGGNLVEQQPFDPQPFANQPFANQECAPIEFRPPHPAPRARSGGVPLIVVVDANPQERILLRSELETMGYLVEALPDPNLAVALMRHRTPVALLCESEAFPGAMPGGGEMSGYDLCVIVRRNPRLGRIPVILTTRTGLPSDFATAHALGATVCVAKPYDMGRITNLLRMLAPVG